MKELLAGYRSSEWKRRGSLVTLSLTYPPHVRSLSWRRQRRARGSGGFRFKALLCAWGSQECRDASDRPRPPTGAHGGPWVGTGVLRCPGGTTSPAGEGFPVEAAFGSGSREPHAGSGSRRPAQVVWLPRDPARQDPASAAPLAAPCLDLIQHQKQIHCQDSGQLGCHPRAALSVTPERQQLCVDPTGSGQSRDCLRLAARHGHPQRLAASVPPTKYSRKMHAQPGTVHLIGRLLPTRVGHSARCEWEDWGERERERSTQPARAPGNVCGCCNRRRGETAVPWELGLGRPLDRLSKDSNLQTINNF